MNDLILPDVKIFVEIDDVLRRSIVIGDPLVAIEYGSELIAGARLKGYALAKLLHGIKTNWEIYSRAGTEDSFESMIHAQIGISPETSEKYVRMWQSIFENPDVDQQTRELLFGKPIEYSLLLTASVADGDLQGDSLKMAAVAEDKSELRSIIRKARGDKTSSGTAVLLFITMRDKGNTPAYTIFCKRKNEKRILGTLLAPMDELSEKGISKLLGGAKVMEVY
jgi:hypothetical protein